MASRNPYLSLFAQAGGRTAAHQELAAADPGAGQAGRQAQREAQAPLHPGGPAEGREGPHHRLHRRPGAVQQDVRRGAGCPAQSQAGQIDRSFFA